jgi:cyclohexanecarboxylate-CoA ligase
MVPVDSAAAGGPEVFKGRGWWRSETVLDDLRAAAARHPGKAAIVAYRAGGGPPQTLTFAELSAATERIAGALAALGVGRGDIVAVQLPNCWQYTALCLACARVGAAVNPLLTILRRREVEFMMRRTGARVCVTPVELRGFSHARMLAEVQAVVPTLAHVLLLDTSHGAFVKNYQSLAAAAGGPGPERSPGPVLDFGQFCLGHAWERKPRPGLAEAAPDDLAQVMFTSGTTGEPKGVMHSHNTLYSLTRAESQSLRLTGEDVITMGSPMTHQAGYAYCFLMPMLLGATAVYQDVWDPALMLRLVEEQRVTFAMGATTFLADAISEQSRAPRDLSSLRVFACGGSPIPPSVVERAGQVLGVRVHALWGMTENGTVTITRPDDPPEHAAVSDGRPVEWMEARITGPGGSAVAPGETGRLQVRGASQCLGYLGRRDLYEAALAPGGWFDTGDLARDDGHGGIRIAGRVKDLILRGGEKVPVVEVEAALLRHQGVQDVAVVGYPDERLGERACAIVVCDGSPPTLDDLTAHLAELGMAKQYWPERLEILPELPKTPSGKIQKYLLRDMVAGG